MDLYSCSLPVDVKFDEATGGWNVDGLPVLLVPRHFYVNIQKALEQGLGEAQTRKLLWDAGYGSAETWCQQQQQVWGFTGAALFSHYMQSASRRGYGILTPQLIDIPGGRAKVRLDNSAYVAEFGAEAGRNVCYMFEGVVAGGMAAVSKTLGFEGEWTAREVQCAAHGATHCAIEGERR